MTDSRPLTCFVSQFALACNLTTVCYLLTLEEGPLDWFFPQSLLVYAPLVYLINQLFLRRERTMLSLSILNCLLGAAMLAGYLLLEPWRGLMHLASSAMFLAWLTVRGCRFALNGPPLRGTLLTLDCSFLLLIAFTGYSAAMDLPTHWGIPALCGLSASIIATATSRTPRAWNVKGWLAVGAAFGLLLLLIGFFVGVIAAPAGSGLVALWTAFTTGVNMVKQLIFRFLAYLLSLLPDADPGEMDWYEAPEFSMPEDPAVPEESPVAGAILLVMVAVCGVCVFTWLIRHLGRLRLSRSTSKTASAPPRRERTPLLRGLLRLMSSLAAELRLRFCLWKTRNTPVGLYFLLVHRCRRTPWRKRPSETPREFLLRMAASAQSETPLASALKKLAWETDAAFYSGRPAPSRLEYAPMIRRRIGTAVRKQFLRELVSRLRPANK